MTQRPQPRRRRDRAPKLPTDEATRRRADVQSALVVTLTTTMSRHRRRAGRRRCRNEAGRCRDGRQLPPYAAARSPSRSSYASTACSSTSAPAAQSGLDVCSASLWLRPPSLGTKIIVVGATAAIDALSWLAPDVISLA